MVVSGTANSDLLNAALDCNLVTKKNAVMNFKQFIMEGIER